MVSRCGGCGAKIVLYRPRAESDILPPKRLGQYWKAARKQSVFTQSWPYIEAKLSASSEIRGNYVNQLKGWMRPGVVVCHRTR